jgi:DNA primase
LGDVALYTNESKDRVRDAVDFVELVSARTELRRAGPARFEGLCPFHDERTPSFGIDPGQKVYHCFGCQASGDVFTFVQETEGVDFKGAAGRALRRRAAARAGGPARCRAAPPARAPAGAAEPHSEVLRPVPVGLQRGG